MSEAQEKPSLQARKIVRIIFVGLGVIIAAFVAVFIVAWVFFSGVGDYTYDERAAYEVTILTEAAKAYRLKYDAYPTELKDLIQPPDGGKPFVEADIITDPWKRPYQYNPAGPRNNGDQPDIWTVGHNGQLIANWSKP